MLLTNVTNAETALKSYCKSKGYENPIYRIESRASTILDGDIYRYKHYRISVKVNGVHLALGDGMSKRIARKKAAMIGIQQLRLLELQTFWQFYQTALSGGGGRLPSIQSRPMPIGLIQSGHCQIEELVSIPDISTSPPPPPTQQSSMTTATKTLLDPDHQAMTRSRANSEMSMMLNYAVEKLKNYKIQDDETDAAEIVKKQKEIEQRKLVQQETETTVEYFQSNDEYFHNKELEEEEELEELEVLKHRQHMHEAQEEFNNILDVALAIANDGDN